MEPKMPRFLLVEDNALMLDLYAVKFKKAGLDLHELANPDGDFVGKVVDIHPDAILMDIHFEGSQTNGVAAAETLLKDERTKNIPIIFFSNADIQELADKAQRMSSSIGFLIKAEYTPNEMIPKVQELYAEYLSTKAQ